MLGIKAAKVQRYLGNCSLALHLYQLKDLPLLYPFFYPGPFFSRGRRIREACRSFLPFCRWLMTTFQIVYIIKVRKTNGLRMVGFVGLYNVELGRSLRLSLEIFHPEDRRQGYGRNSLELLLNSLQANNVVEKVVVEVSKNNAPSLLLFSGASFRICGQFKDRILLEKCLK
jgi:RimJ/RimL family protein N-acetyltransferase